MEILNHGALCLISIGHRTGLFDALHAYAPCTSEQLANRSGLNERYVREWLGAMIPARIVDCENECFSLREGPLQLLTRGLRRLPTSRKLLDSLEKLRLA